MKGKPNKHNKNKDTSSDKSSHPTLNNNKLYNKLYNKPPLAIIGIGCRLPGNLRGVDELWSALEQGKNCITKVPEDRWSLDKFYDPDTNKAGKIKNNKGGFIKGFSEFDADFFGIYPKVANALDVRQRHILEVTYEAIEDAGIRLEDISGSNTAVIMGIFLSDENKKSAGEDIFEINPHTAMGTADTSVPARIAFQFNLRGPTFAVDTACSSSLVAIHLACNAIWNNEAKMAVAGGVNIMASHEHNIMLSQGGFLSPDGYCKSFDASGNGYVRGEGAGVVIIKPLDDAIRDSDNIYALIRNSVVNSDGHTSDGITVPNEFAQIDMLKKAYSDVGIDPRNVDFIEAHGTGTVVGDPKECFAFANVFSMGRAKENPLIIGSIKSNIGHTEAVAGVAGLIKLTLSLKNKQIPKNLHFKKPNPKIKFDEWKLKVPTSLTKWPEKSLNNLKPAIGGVNSFGAGGTNAHIVVQEYNENDKLVKEIKEEISNKAKEGSISQDLILDQYSLFILSAQSKDALKDLAQKYIIFLEENSTIDVRSLCYSLITKRSSFKEKLVISLDLSDHTEAFNRIISALESYIKDLPYDGLNSGSTSQINSQSNLLDLDPLQYDSKNYKQNIIAPKIAFICSGQGPQWYAMGRQLMKDCKVFRDVVSRIDQIFYKLSGYSLRDEMNRDSKSTRISETRIAQPAIMSVQIGLIEMWKFIGVRPDAVVGHSIGEVAAAYAAGSLTLEDAVKVIFFRSKEQDRASGKGKMLAVSLTYSKAANLLQDHKIKDEVSVAAINGPNSVVLSGDNEPLERIAEDLTSKDIFNKFLMVNVPFHSHHMDIVKDGMLKDLKNLKSSKAKIDLYSTVTGKIADGTHLTADYWYKNVRNSVFFSQAIERMIDKGYTHFIEIAPHPVLASGVSDLLVANKINEGCVIASLSRNIKDFEAGINYEANNFLGAISKALIANIKVDCEKIINVCDILKLPNYVWQHKTYWAESQSRKDSRLKSYPHPLIKSLIEIPFNNDSCMWELSLNTKVDNYLIDHQIGGTIVFPGSGQVEIAYEIGKRTYQEEFLHLEDITFDRAIFLPEDESHTPEVRLAIESKSQGIYKIYSRQYNEEAWTLNGSGKMVKKDSVQNDNVHNYSDQNLSELQKSITKNIDVKDFYKRLSNQGLYYGPNFSLIEEMWISGNKILARINLNESNHYSKDKYNFIPSLFDSALHIILARPDDGAVYLPDTCDSYFLYKKPTNTIWAYVNVTDCNIRNIIGDYIFFNEAGEVISYVKALNAKYLQNSRLKSKDIFSMIYSHVWVEEKIPDQAVINNDNINTKENIIIFSKRDVDETFLNNLRHSYNVSVVTDLRNGNKLPVDYLAINFEDKESFVQLFKDFALQGRKITKVINLLPCFSKVGALDDCNTFSTKSNNLISSTLFLLQEIAEIDHEVRLYFVTCSANKIVAEDQNINFLQGLIYGMQRVFINEYSRHLFYSIDLSGEIGDADLSHLYNEIFADDIDHQSEIAYRKDVRYSRKLIKEVDQENDYKQIKYRDDVTYLITGGVSGLGLAMAEWMLEKGAKNFALVSRSGPKYDRDRSKINEMVNRGARIVWEEVKADVSNDSDIKRVVSYINNNMPALKGVVHCAGILKDATYPNMTLEQYLRVYNVKVLGAWNLHLETLKHDLDLFLMISSVSSLLGIAGQSNYCSANNLLNYISIYRKSLGLVSHSACLGALDAEYAGMTKEAPEVADMAHRMVGLIAIDRSMLGKSIEYLLTSDSAYKMLSMMKWENFVSTSRHVARSYMMKDLLERELSKSSNNGKAGIVDSITIKPIEEQLVMLIDLLKASLSKILGISPEKINEKLLTTNLGLDSLMLNQFRNWIQSNLDVDYPLIKLAKGITIEQLSAELLKKIRDNISSNSDQDLLIESPEKEILEISPDKWFKKIKTGKSAQYKLFCLHPVGAGSSMFDYFMFNPPKGIEIIPLQMPGRENRSDESFYKDMGQLILDLSKVINNEISGPTIFWGHSWGGVILFEIFKNMRKEYTENCSKIKHLIISGSIAPQLTLNWKNRESIKETTNLDNSFSKVMKTVSYVDDKDFVESIFPIMQKDMELISSYRYKSEDPIDIPITAFAALEDEVVLLDEIKQWKVQTTKSFNLFQVHGDHWFLSRNKEFITEKITDSIYKEPKGEKDLIRIQN